MNRMVPLLNYTDSHSDLLIVFIRRTQVLYSLALSIKLFDRKRRYEFEL